MFETVPELNFQSLMTCNQSSGFDLGFGIAESIPDMFESNPVVPDLAADVLPYPGPQEHFHSIPLLDDLPSEIMDFSIYQYHNQLQQQQQPHQQQNWETLSVPSSTTSPVQFGSVDGYSIPTGYEEPRLNETNFVNGRKRRACPHPCQETNEFNNHFENGDRLNNSAKPKRKRVQNGRQRKEANVRERKRMVQLNDAFDSLKTKVPTFAYEKRLSRMETLKLAMSYISFMSELLDGKKSEDNSMKANGLNSFTLADIGQLQSSLSSSYVSDGTESSESGSISS